MRLEFLPATRREVVAAGLYYEGIEPGLGARFRGQVQQSALAILAEPRRWRERSGGYRRVNLAGFPYYLAYVVRGERVVVVAVAHAARRPGYFAPRIPSRPEEES